MPQPLLDFINDIMTKNWFAVAALAIMFFIQFSKTTWAAALYAKIPNGYRFIVPVALAAGAAFVHGFLAHETLGASIWDAVKIAFSAMGGAAALKESPLPWGNVVPDPRLASTRLPPPPPEEISESDRVTPVDGPGFPPDPPAAA